MIWIALLSIVVKLNVLSVRLSLACALVLTLLWNRVKRIVQNNTVIMRGKIFVWLVIGLMLSCGASRKLASTTEVKQDTTTVEKIVMVDYRPMAQLNLEIGKSISIPGLNIRVTRVNEHEAVVQGSTEVITQRETTVQLVATKTVDRSKDKSINDSEVGTKVKTDIDTKEKKANNEKVKENNKQVRRGSTWLIWIIFVLALLVMIRLKFWKLLK